MSYPERKPIYDTYKKIISKIISEQKHEEYARSEIDALNLDLLSTFKEIQNMKLLDKNW